LSIYSLKHRPIREESDNEYDYDNASFASRSLNQSIEPQLQHSEINPTIPPQALKVNHKRNYSTSSSTTTAYRRYEKLNHNVMHPMGRYSRSRVPTGPTIDQMKSPVLFPTKDVNNNSSGSSALENFIKPKTEKKENSIQKISSTEKIPDSKNMDDVIMSWQLPDPAAIHSMKQSDLISLQTKCNEWKNKLDDDYNSTISNDTGQKLRGLINEIDSEFSKRKNEEMKNANIFKPSLKEDSQVSETTPIQVNRHSFSEFASEDSETRRSEPKLSRLPDFLLDSTLKNKDTNNTTEISILMNEFDQNKDNPNRVPVKPIFLRDSDNQLSNSIKNMMDLRADGYTPSISSLNSSRRRMPQQ
jgi:hypothetical protein